MRLRQIIAEAVSAMSPRLFFTIAYLHNRHRWPHLRNPRDISEIGIKRILDGEIDKIYYLADKYRVRQYVEKHGLGHILTPLIGVYAHPEEIDFNVLPDRFALKCNTGAGMNLICKDKKSLITPPELLKMQKWMERRNFSHSERHYNLIERCILCEEYIDDGTGSFPTDYKFMCMHGQVFCVLVCAGRDTENTHYSPYSTKWVGLPQYNRSGTLDEAERPANLEEMIQVAECLSQDIDMVRVDLYSNGSRIWFGEMTLTPAGCIFHNWSNQAMDDMGEFYRKTNTK